MATRPQAFQFRSSLATFYNRKREFEKDFGIEEKRLKKQFGKDPSEKDVLWGLANHLLQEKMKLGDFGALRQLYFEMALYLHEAGKTCFVLQQQSQKMMLMSYSTSYKDMCKKVEISANVCCDTCRKQDGKIFPIDEAVKKMPIPPKDCTNKINKEAPDGWCVCSYLPVLDD